MNNMVYRPQPDDKVRELRLITRSLMLLALLTGILYARVFITTTMKELDASGQGAIGILSFLFLVTAIIGLLLTWRWEGPGGIVVLLSGIGLTVLTFFIVPKTESPWLSAFFYGSPFIITGCLCLLCWWRANKV